MGDWENTRIELRQKFVAGSAARLARIESDLGRLGAEPGDARALADLRLAFHGFSGSGGSYGFPEVTSIGLDGERRCEEVGLAGGPGRAELADLRGLLDRLRVELGVPHREAAAAAQDLVHAPAVPFAADVLIVGSEADAGARDAFRERLEAEGMSVRMAASVAEARTEIGRRVPNGAVVDIRLADGTAYQVIEHLRSVADGPAAAVFVVGGNELESRVGAIRCGADGYFTRPFDADVLLRRLQFLIDRTRESPARILCVEDDADQAALVKELLESAGYDVRLCANPLEFSAEMAAFRPNLVLMDVNLPGASGYDLARLLRQDETNPTLAVVFLTTRGDIAARIEGARSGGDDHLVKPVPPGLLLSTVAARLERSRFLQGLLERDGLTRLLSHTAFLERVKEAVARIGRSPGARAAFVMVDLDYFKSVNDQYGHPVGDRVLVSLAGALRRHLRQSDNIGRLGGEEFGILLENLSEDEALRLMERLLLDFSAVEHARPGGGAFAVTFSAGVAMFRTPMDWKSWIGAADGALYQAKAAGRNRVVGQWTAPGLPH